MDRGSWETALSNLRSLSLSVVSFVYAAKEMQYTLNVTGLRSLKLSNCPHSLGLLDAVVSTAQLLRLKSFELVIDVDWDDDQGVDGHIAPIFSFLTAFTGLEDVALLLTDSVDWARLSHAVSHHSSTLRRTTTHARRESREVELVGPPIPWSIATQELYQNTNLDFIGTSHASTEMVMATPQSGWRESQLS